MKYVVIYSLLTVLFVSQSAQAYVDPGAASMAIQAIIAAVAGGAIAFRRVRKAVTESLSQLWSRFGHNDH